MNFLGAEEIKTLAFWKAVLAEFLASILFLFAVTSFCVAAGWGISESFSGQVVHIGLGIGLTISTLAQCIGHISGGHINPAVTAGMLVIRKISLLRAILYVVVQCIGAIVGTALTYGLTPAIRRGTLGANAIKPGLEPAQGFGMEIFLTFILVFTVCAVTDPGKKVEPYGTTLAIGISILICHLSGIAYTGTSINPARSFGPAVVMDKFEDHWVFWVGPILGGILAALTYEFLFKTESQRKSDGNADEEQEPWRPPSRQADFTTTDRLRLDARSDYQAVTGN